jgi:hypothetical protein
MKMYHTENCANTQGFRCAGNIRQPVAARAMETFGFFSIVRTGIVLLFVTAIVQYFGA